MSQPSATQMESSEPPSTAEQEKYGFGATDCFAAPVQQAAPPAGAKTLTVILPAYNEAASILDVLRELDAVISKLALECAIVVVDDGSRDETVDRVLSAKLSTPISLVRLSRNFGKEMAISAGLSQAESFDAVVLMDADGQHPPEMIVNFISEWEAGFDDVYGVRTSRETDRWPRRLMSRLFYLALPPDARQLEADAGDFRLLSSRVVRALNRLPEKHRYMKGLYSWVGFRKKSLAYTVRPRLVGESRFSMFALVRFAVTGITSFSTLPLRVITRLGFTIAVPSLFYGVYVLFKTLILGTDLPGWATLTVALCFLSGIQLVSIGVLGEYIGQIFVEAKDRPLYVIDEMIDIPATSAPV